MLRNITNLILIATALATAIVLGVSQPSLGADVSVEEGDGTGDGWLDNVIIGATDGTDSSTESVSTDGNPTDKSSSGPSAPRDPMAGLGQSQEERYCGWTDPFGQLPANDPAWNGHSPSEGVLKWKSCAVLFPGAPGAPGDFEGRPVVYGFFPNGAPIAPPPIDPAILAQRAFRELAIPVPVVNAGPDPTKLAVNLWTWLWVNNNPGQSASLSPPVRSPSLRRRHWRQSPGRSANPQPRATPTNPAAPRPSPARAPAPPHPRPTTGKPSHPAATSTTGAHSKNVPVEPAPGPSPPPPTGPSPGSPTPESPAAPPSTQPPTTSSTSANTAPSSSKDPADDPHPKGIRLPSTHRPSAPNSTAHTSPAH